MAGELDPRSRAECDANLRAFTRAIATMTRGGEVREVGPTLLTRTGLPTPSFNCVLALEPVAEVRGVVEAIDAFLISAGVPWQMITTPSVRRDLRRLIDTFELERRRLYPLMTLALGSPPAAPPGLEIQRVTDAAGIQAWEQAFEIGADAPAGFIEPWMAGLAGSPEFRDERLRLFLGRVDGVPVATSARMSTGRWAGVYCVNTHARLRGRGYGTAMSWAAADGRSDGRTASCLQASAMGAAVYASMGYRTVGEYEIWQPAAPTPRT